MRFSIETLGCKVNQYESQALESLLRARGHEPAEPGGACDAVIVNTCAVTAESGRKSRQAVRRAKKQYPGAVVAVCGCWSQIEPEEASALEADIVYGSGDRRALAEDIERAVEERTRITKVDEALRRRTFEELPVGSYSGRTRAMLKVQDGCVNFCAYCVIPYARGPVRSLPVDRAAEAAAGLCRSGFREIVVTGIEISSYGADLNGPTLIDLLERVAEAAPGVRIRLGSLEPRIITEEFTKRAAEIGTLCPHFHLSLQSGCDDTLRRMRRKYDTARFYESVALLRGAFPGCGLTADLITGFPGEDDREFDETLAFLEKCAFSSMHVFPYSRRPGTPAASMPDQVKNAVKKERAARASALAERMAQDFRKRLVGCVQQVLFETEKDGRSFGHTGSYVMTGAEGSGLRNCILPVQINAEKNGILCGKVLLPDV